MFPSPSPRPWTRTVARALLSICLLASTALWAAQGRVHFAPLPENDVLQSLRDIAGDSDPRSPVTSVISLTVATGGTVIYWDHWENGYEANVFAPANIYSSANPQGTQIWGDRNLANGCPPIRTGEVNPCAVPEDDFLRAGDVAYTRNEVPIRGNNGNYSRDPDSDCTLWPTGATLRDHCFDGRDKIGSTFPLVVSRAAWADGSGSLLAGALEVTSTSAYLVPGGTLEVPVGPLTANSANMFEYAALYIMGGEGGATGQVTRPGQSSVAFNLAQGEGRLVGYNREGTTVQLTSGAAQAHLITGDIRSNYESRWYLLLPNAAWGNEYISPVGTSTACTRLFAYNPGGSALAVQYSDGAGNTETINVPSKRAIRSREIPGGVAARLTATAPFNALSVTDCNGGEIHDWGHSLVPVDLLTTQFLTGWAPGCTTANCGASGSGSNTGSRLPLWITPASGTGVNIYVDFDGQGAECISADQVFGKALKLTLDAGQAATVTDNPPPNPATGSQGDYDMTGARVFTCDGTEFSVVWGLDPSLSGNSDGEALDMGAAVLPIGSALRCGIRADKDTVIAQGDTRVTYTFKIFNDGDTGLRAVNLTNEFTSGTVTPVDPSGSPPCDSPTYVSGDSDPFGELDPDEIWEYTCTVDVVPEPAQPPPPQFIPVINAAVATSGAPSFLESQACSWEINVIQADLDYGDAPTSYGSPSHLVPASPQLYIGQVVPDADPGLQASVGADGDDLNGTDDEDGVTFEGLVGGAVRTTVSVTNSNQPGQSHTLCAWIDGAISGIVDGLFQDSEGQCQTGQPGGGVLSYVFDWNIPNLAQVLTYARFRVSTDPLTTADGGLGTAADGEIEDYALSILPTRASIGSFRVDLVPAEGLDLTDPETGGPLIDPRSGEALQVPPAGAAEVRWETLSEQGTLGFHLERWDTPMSHWIRVNKELLPGLIDAPLGGEYRLFDLDVAAGESHRYRLVELEAWGDRRVHGPYDVIVGGGDAGAAGPWNRAARRGLQRSEGIGPRAFSAPAVSPPDETEDASWGQWRQLDSGYQGRARLPHRARGLEWPEGRPGHPGSRRPTEGRR